MARGEEKLIRVHIQLYERDWERLLSFYGGNVKRSSVVRELVHNWVKRIDARAEQSASHEAKGGDSDDV